MHRLLVDGLRAASLDILFEKPVPDVRRRITAPLSLRSPNEVATPSKLRKMASHTLRSTPPLVTFDSIVYAELTGIGWNESK